VRLHIHLQPVGRTSELPIDNYPLASTIYRLLYSVAPEYAVFLHEEGFAAESSQAEGPEQRPSDKKFKFFVFSRLAQRNKKIVGDRVWLNDSLVTWQIASPLEEMMGALAESLVANPQIVIGDQKSQAAFVVAGIDIAEPPRVSGRLRGETISPIFVSVDETNPDGKRIKHHVRAEDHRFAERIRANLHEKYRALMGDSPDGDAGGDLVFEFTEPPRSQLVQYKTTNHKCYLGRFVLSGDPRLIRLAWEAGLGEANSKGFGMIRALQAV
jgi:CRISPR-associated endoribonuclease Cas6